jgi:hypothetical protein
MGILSVSVKVGEGVQIGDLAFIKVDDKSGSRVNLKIATVDPAMRVQRVPTGIIPERFHPPGIAAPRSMPALA